MAIRKSELTKRDLKFIDKFACRLPDCDDHFRFVTTKYQIVSDNPKAKVYRGQCEKCGKVKTLTKKQMERWSRIFTSSRVEVSESTFDQLFDPKE